ncbi:MAG: hypothetical protein ABIH09_01350 [Candidatus Omnitrophota bacterium]
MKYMKCSLPVIILKEGKNFIAYTPALDISTSATTVNKAKKRFEELVHIFFEELEEMGTTEEVLANCGWIKSRKNKKQVWQSPRFITEMDETFKIPCPA